MKFGQPLRDRDRADAPLRVWTKPPCPYCAVGEVSQLATGCVRCTTIRLRAHARDGEWLLGEQLVGWVAKGNPEVAEEVRARWEDIEARVRAGGKA